MNAIGIAIKQLRDEKKLSTNDLAKMTGISQSTISKLENGKRSADIDILNKIATALNTDINNIINGPKSLREMYFEKIFKNNISIDELADKTGLMKSEIREALLSISNFYLDDFIKIGLFLGFTKGFIERADIYENFVRQQRTSEVYIENLNSLYDKWISTDTNDIISKNQYVSEAPEEFTDPNEAREYIKKHHRVFAADGFEADKIDDEKILAFANALLEQIRLVGYKYTKR